MREKLVVSMMKLLSTNINNFQTYMYFNMYMTRVVFFGYDSIDLLEKQNKDLRKVYENLISKRLDLGKKFLCKVLYSWRLVLGVGLV